MAVWLGSSQRWCVEFWSMVSCSRNVAARRYCSFVVRPADVRYKARRSKRKGGVKLARCCSGVCLARETTTASVWSGVVMVLVRLVKQACGLLYLFVHNVCACFCSLPC